MTMQISPAGLEFVKQWEAFRASPYDDIGGVRTIGYGHAIQRGEKFIEVTKLQATDMLFNDMEMPEHWVERYITAPLNQNQFDALCSLVFNCGPGPIQKTMGRLINDGKTIEAAQQFDDWINVNHKPVHGLINRRAAEKKLFLTPVIIADNGAVNI